MILLFETGYFAALWRNVALKLGLEVDFVPGDWRHGVDPAVVEARLNADRERKIKAVAIVHNETSTGVTSQIHEVRKAIDRASHPALLMVDTISSLASIDYRHFDLGRLQRRLEMSGGDAGCKNPLQVGRQSINSHT